jgi:hypothetical protein
MTVADFQYYENYKAQLRKFIFSEKSLRTKDYIRLNDEIRNVDLHLQKSQKIFEQISINNVYCKY